MIEFLQKTHTLHIKKLYTLMLHI